MRARLNLREERISKNLAKKNERKRKSACITFLLEGLLREKLVSLTDCLNALWTLAKFECMIIGTVF